MGWAAGAGAFAGFAETGGALGAEGAAAAGGSSFAGRCGGRAVSTGFSTTPVFSAGTGDFATGLALFPSGAIGELGTPGASGRLPALLSTGLSKAGRSPPFAGTRSSLRVSSRTTAGPESPLGGGAWRLRKSARGRSCAATNRTPSPREGKAGLVGLFSIGPLGRAQSGFPWTGDPAFTTVLRMVVTRWSTKVICGGGTT